MTEKAMSQEGGQQYELIHCTKCGMDSFGEPTQHTAECPNHDPETCATCDMSHEEAQALAARLVKAERYMAAIEQLTGTPASDEALATLRAFAEASGRVDRDGRPWHRQVDAEGKQDLGGAQLGGRRRDAGRTRRA